MPTHMRVLASLNYACGVIGVLSLITTLTIVLPRSGARGPFQDMFKIQLMHDLLYATALCLCFLAASMDSLRNQLFKDVTAMMFTHTVEMSLLWMLYIAKMRHLKINDRDHW